MPEGATSPPPKERLWAHGLKFPTGTSVPPGGGGVRATPGRKRHLSLPGPSKIPILQLPQRSQDGWVEVGPRFVFSKEKKQPGVGDSSEEGQANCAPARLATATPSFESPALHRASNAPSMVCEIGKVMVGRPVMPQRLHR